jgi:hypothetical protein
MSGSDIISIKSAKVILADLHYQYIHNFTPVKLWNFNMGLPTSPHVELLRLIKEKGFDWGALWDTRYVEERVCRREKGMSKWTNEHIREHIQTRWATYKSLKKYGYDPGKHTTKKGRQYPVRILGCPFWTTRFGIDRDWLDGMEIWDGGGRSAAAYVLGWKKIPAIICKDAFPGSMEKGMFKDKLKHISGVWDNGNCVQ